VHKSPLLGASFASDFPSGSNWGLVFTTTENRKVTATAFGCVSLGIGIVALLCLSIATIFRLVHGLDRQSDGALSLASAVALLALVVGGGSGCYSWLLVRSRLAKVALVLCVLPLPASIIIARLAGGHW
jgi:hypothetical protein